MCVSWCAAVWVLCCVSWLSRRRRVFVLPLSQLEPHNKSAERIPPFGRVGKIAHCGSMGPGFLNTNKSRDILCAILSSHRAGFKRESCVCVRGISICLMSMCVRVCVCVPVSLMCLPLCQQRGWGSACVCGARSALREPCNMAGAQAPPHSDHARPTFLNFCAPQLSPSNKNSTDLSRLW